MMGLVFAKKGNLIFCPNDPRNPRQNPTQSVPFMIIFSRKLSKNNGNSRILGVILPVISWWIVGTFLLSSWVPILMDFLVNVWLISACFFIKILALLGLVWEPRKSIPTEPARAEWTFTFCEQSGMVLGKI